MSQPAVTEYFAKKRKRACTQSAKRLKLAETDAKSSIKEVKICSPIITEIREVKRKNTRPKRTTRKTKETKQEIVEKAPPAHKSQPKLRAAKEVEEIAEPLNLHISPSASESESEKAVEVITSIQDNHDEPCTPSKRSRKNTKATEIKKRGRISPKKRNAYDFSATQVSENLAPDINFKTKTKKTAKKKLTLVQNTEVLNLASVSEPKSNENKSETSIPTTSVPSTVTSNDSNKEQTSAREQRKLKRQKTQAIAEKLLSKKKESTTALKESIKGTSKLKDLQETLLKIREQKKKQQQNEKIQKHREKMDERQKEINKIKTKSDVPNKREFAYQKLHSLAQELPKGLMLPYKYKVLLEMFKSTDTVVSMLFNRQQTTTWSMLQKSVREMTRKNYEKSNLAQIKTVFPEAYLYRQEKGIISYDGEIKQSDYQLTLEPVLNAEECKAFGDDPKKLTSNMLVRRRHHFSFQLLNMAKEYHKKFLETLSPPMEDPGDKLRRWHPQFSLDQVPDVALADLPLSPLETAQKCCSAKDVLEKARSKFTKKAVEALKKVAEKVTPEKSRQKQPLIIEENNNTPVKEVKPTPMIETKPASRGVSQSLLEKIRAKEADKKMKSMIRPEKDVEKIAMLKKLPDVARAARMLFISEKKAALPFDVVCEKLSKSSRGIATPDVALQHMYLLVAELPGWMSLAKVGKVQYIRMNKTWEMSKVVKDLETRVKIVEKS